MPCIGKSMVVCPNWENNHSACVRCGWEYNEARRRANIPLTPTRDGKLYSKKVKLK